MSGSIFDALTDPRTAALMGLTAGFGEAAMPTRMPIPLGAALAKGVSGMLPAIQQAQQTRMGNIQQQQAQIGLDWYKNAMQPGGGGAPFGAPSAGGDMNNQYLVPPKMLASMIPMMVAQGKDPSGIAKLVESYSGGQGYAMGPDARAFAVPGGLADPGVVGRKAAAEAYGKGSGGAPFVAPTEYPVPVLNPDGSPRLDESGQPVLEKRYLSPTQANQRTAGGGAGAIPATDPQTAASNALATITDPKARQMAVTAMLSQKLPIAAWAPWIAGLHHESRWNLGVGDNKNENGTYDIGPGQVNSGNIPKLGVTEQQLRDPQTNLNTSAKMFGDSWGQSAGSPAGAYAHYNTGRVNGTPTAGYLEDTMPRLAAYGYPGVAAAPQQVSTMTPTVQTAGPGVPTSPMALVGTNPNASVNVAGRTSPAPAIGGMPALTPQQEADLKVDTANRMPAEVRVGGLRAKMDRSGNPTDIMKNPEHITVENQDGTKTVGHLEPASPTAPPGTPGTFVPVAQLDRSGNVIPANVGNSVSPDTQAARTHLVEEFHGKDQDSYVAAQNTQGWLNQIDHAADVVNKAGSAYQTGPFAETRLGLMGKINDIGRTVGLGNAFNPQALASAEELRKATTTAGFELSSHYEGHARQAASTIQNATSAVPGYSNSPQGVQLVSAGIREGAQSAMDAHEYRQNRYNGVDPYGINPAAKGKTAGAGLETAETDFYKKFTPQMYATRAISTVQPPTMKADSLDAFNKQAMQYLPGTQVILNGQPKIIPARPDAPAIPVYIQQRLMGAAH